MQRDSLALIQSYWHQDPQIEAAKQNMSTIVAQQVCFCYWEYTSVTDYASVTGSILLLPSTNDCVGSHEEAALDFVSKAMYAQVPPSM